MEERTVKVGSSEIKIHELTTEDESRIRANSQVWNSKKKISEPDQARLDANIIVASVIPETWPKEWGLLTVENVRKLPSKQTRRLLTACHRLNILDEDVSDFLDEQRQSQEATSKETTAFSTP